MIDFETLSHGLLLIIVTLDQSFPGYIIHTFFLRWVEYDVIRTTGSEMHSPPAHASDDLLIIDLDAAASVLFEIGWAVVRSALEGDSQIPLDRALTTLNQIVGLGLLPRHD